MVAWSLLLLVLLILKRQRYTFLPDQNGFLIMFINRVGWWKICWRLWFRLRNVIIRMHLPLLSHWVLCNFIIIIIWIIIKTMFRVILHSPAGFITIVKHIYCPIWSKPEVVGSSLVIGRFIIPWQLVLLGCSLTVPGRHHEPCLVVEGVFLLLMLALLVVRLSGTYRLRISAEILSIVHSRYLLQQCLSHLNSSLLPACWSPMWISRDRFTTFLVYLYASFWIVVRKYFYFISLISIPSIVLTLYKVFISNVLISVQVGRICQWWI